VTAPAPWIRSCEQCGTHLAPAMLACPACGRLVHAGQLRALAADAEDAAGRGDIVGALGKWREALDLLPAGSRQREVVTAKVNALSEQVRTDPAVARAAAAAPQASQPTSAGGQGKLKAAAAAVGGVGLLLWKFKFAAGFLLTKGKLLLLGLTKASTLFSMLLATGVYWTLWGWQFAVGLVLSIYVHEMGHVVMLRRYGFKASAPMFIPGIGALIRLQQHPVNPREDAAIGLAGPVYGLVAALASYGLWHATGHPVFAAVAQVGAWINLFNLIVIPPLDGGRAFNALSRNQRWLGTLALGTAWFLTAGSHSQGLLGLLTIVAVVRTAVGTADPQGDARATAQYVALVAVLSLMCLIPVPTGQP
jgi:Zn-dependent protease